ncbi:MAG: hypothetical protein ACLP9L_30135 [Thermoguttaceae bacterium]
MMDLKDSMNSAFGTALFHHVWGSLAAPGFFTELVGTRLEITMAVDETEPISPTWRQFRYRFRSRTLPLLVFVAFTVATILMWVRQRDLPPSAFRAGYGIFSEQATRH